MSALRATRPASCGPAPGLERSLWIPALLAALVLALDTLGVDRAVAHWFYDPASHAFPLRHAYLLDTVMHRWTKYAVVAMALIAAVGYAATFVQRKWLPYRRVLVFLVLGLVLAPSAVSGLKAVTDRQCPWDIDEFGGAFPYRALLQPAPAGTPPGRCFPAGHASTGFALMAFYFVGIGLGRPRAARLGLAVGMVAGALLGLGRMAQGAHFLSHTVASGIVCWLVLLAVHYFVLQRPASALVLRETPLPVG